MEDAAENLPFSRPDEFPQLKGNIYLDHAGATLFAKSQLEAWKEQITSELVGNPHSRHGPSQLTSSEIGKVRRRILAYFNTDSSSYSVIFTSGATAGLKLVAENIGFSSTSTFAHLREIHTSVLGLREIAHASGASVLCLPDPPLAALLAHPLPSQDSVSLFAFPGQCNFSGKKYPLDSIFSAQSAGWTVLLDAAGLVSTSALDLGTFKPDFVVMSFYKMFGFPTGLGALLVKKEAGRKLGKTYFGGGTVDIAVGEERFHVFRTELHQRFEDGTSNFLDILALNHGFDALSRLGGGISHISSHTFRLAQYAYTSLKSLHHANGNPVSALYTDGDFDDRARQGPIITFNLKTCTGGYIGFLAVEKVMETFKVQVRTGCFCNMGACQKWLGLSVADLKANYKAGHVCGDSVDLIDGRPTGAVRISFGYMSTESDVDAFLQIIREVFVEKEKAIPAELIHRRGAQELNVHSLYMYPIKSCRGIRLQEWPVEASGFIFDRSCFIQNSSGTTVTLKHNPALLRIYPKANVQSGEIVLSAPGRGNLQVQIAPKNGYTDHKHLPNGNTEEDVLAYGRVCGEKVQAVSCGPKVSLWLTCVLSNDDTYSLMRYSHRLDSVSSSLSAANSAPFLLICTASIRELLRTIPSPHEFTLDDIIQRMRPNIVVETGDAFEEDQWKRVRIGKVELEALERCARCHMVNVDPGSGQRTVEPLRSIVKLRGKEMNFGILVRPVNLSDLDYDDRWMRLDSRVETERSPVNF